MLPLSPNLHQLKCKIQGNMLWGTSFEHEGWDSFRVYYPDIFLEISGLHSQTWKLQEKFLLWRTNTDKQIRKCMSGLLWYFQGNHTVAGKSRDMEVSITFTTADKSGILPEFIHTHESFLLSPCIWPLLSPNTDRHANCREPSCCDLNFANKQVRYFSRWETQILLRKFWGCMCEKGSK